MIKKIISDLYRYFHPLNKVEMYRKMGVKIGENCKIQFDVIIDYSHYWHIEIGNNVTLAPRVHILAHDASTFNKFGYTKIGKVSIGNNCFIGASSIILPNVNIGNNSIVGAGSIVRKDVPANTVVAGNPAKTICSVKEYHDKITEEMKKHPLFEENYTIRKGVSLSMQEEMNIAMDKGIGFVR